MLYILLLPQQKSFPLMYCLVDCSLVFTVILVAVRVVQKFWKRGVLSVDSNGQPLAAILYSYVGAAYHYITLNFHPLYTFYRFMNIVRKAISWTVRLLLDFQQCTSVHAHFWQTPMVLTTTLVQCKVDRLLPLESSRNSHRDGWVI